MYPAERRLAILEEARAGDGRVSVARLSARLGVTSSTIRRDLDDLEREGVIRRQHGGAQLLRTLPFETSLLARRATEAAERHSIAKAVVELLPDDGVVLLDSGALMLSIAEIFPTDRDLVVITNNLPAAALLADNPRLTLIALPGRVRSLTQAAVDERTRSRLDGLHVDLAVLGANGVTSDGVSTTIPAEAAVKHQMVTTARTSVLAVTASKVGITSFCMFAAIADFEHIFTDARITADQRADLEEAGAALTIVEG